MSRHRPIHLLLFVTFALAAVVLASPVHAQRATVQVYVDTTGASTRLVLTHSRPVTYDVHRAEGAIEVIYTEAIEAIPAENRLDDPILRRFQLKESRRLVFTTGPGYRSAETFELRNPFRLVIDMTGTRPDGVASAAPDTRRDPSQKVIVIDPGHGGMEEGAKGPTGLLEKEITLDLAQRLEALLDRDPNITVVLTREGDRLVGLDERTAIANYNSADLFLSIHVNASRRTKARGAETYFLSAEATDDAARTLAALENQATGVSEESLRARDEKKRDNLDLVLWDLAQNQYLAESSLLAESMQAQMNQLGRTPDRGVRQAPFRVLMGATMPAILVEVGFISNPDEEQLLRSLGYRNQVASAMAGAVYEFLERLQRYSRPGGTREGEGTAPR